MDKFQRLRTIDDRQYYPLTRTYTPWLGAPGSPQALLGSVGGLHKTIRDTNHPGFKLRRKQGEWISSDVEIYENVGVPSIASGTIGAYRNWGTVSYSGSAMALLEVIQPPWHSLEADRKLACANVLIKAYAKMNESPLLGGETLKDMNKSLAMLRRPFSSAVELLSYMARHKKPLTGKTAEAAARINASSWLEYRYGWQPIIMDISKIIQETHFSSVKARQSRVVARGSQDFTYEGDRSGPFTNPNDIYTGTYASHLILKSKASAGVAYSVRNRNSGELAMKTAGLDARSIPATLWESVPYSFVVDWFVNVGPWLQAVTPDSFITVLGNWVTFNDQCWQTWKGTTDVTLGPERDDPKKRFQISWGEHSRYTRHYRRDVDVPLSLTPQLTNKNLSLLHSVDSASLLLGKVLNALHSFKH